MFFIIYPVKKKVCESIIIEECSTHFLRMNEEFMDQLALYELMDCKVDTTNPLYKQFRLKKIIEKYPGMYTISFF